jgi:hypothetical protein
VPVAGRRSRRSTFLRTSRNGSPTQRLPSPGTRSTLSGLVLAVKRRTSRVTSRTTTTMERSSKVKGLTPSSPRRKTWPGCRWTRLTQVESRLSRTGRAQPQASPQRGSFRNTTGTKRGAWRALALRTSHLVPRLLREHPCPSRLFKIAPHALRRSP